MTDKNQFANAATTIHAAISYERDVSPEEQQALDLLWDSANASSDKDAEIATLTRENGELLQTLGRKDKEIAALKADNAALGDMLARVARMLEHVDVPDEHAHVELAACRMVEANHPGASLLSEMESLKAEIRALARSLRDVMVSFHRAGVIPDRDFFGPVAIHFEEMIEIEAAVALPETQRQLAQVEDDT